MIRLGILGCGAITRRRHLSAVIAHPEVQVEVLVDADLERAKMLRQLYGIDCQVATDYQAITDKVDAVINALPNYLHAPVNLHFLHAGVHVLCEKPLTLTAAEARACGEVADKEGAVLAVAMAWRFRTSSELLGMVLKEGLLGSLQGYDWEFGMPYEWPSVSGFFLSRAQAGGGILIDEGVHLLDCLLHWFGPVTDFEYWDDNWGSGIEANAVLNLCHQSPYGELKGRVRLSRTYALRNRLRVEGGHARAEIVRDDPNSVILRRSLAGREVGMALQLPRRNGAGAPDPFQAQLADFIESIRGGRKPMVDCWHALEVLSLVERCYSKRRRLEEPWLEVGEPIHARGR